CKANDIIPEAYHSLAKVSEENKKTLTDIGKKHDKLWSQVILNYQIHEGLVVIPKSHNPVNQKNNIDVFDFHLTEEDKTIIRNM
ncbi:MAG: aldo/keto reductase, partial [Acholeplasmataceae bacterium]